MLPSSVMVAWVRDDIWCVRNADTYQVVFNGPGAEVRKWLRLHSYVGVWGMANYNVSPMGNYVRKERA